jgi:hypothetical protein
LVLPKVSTERGGTPRTLMIQKVIQRKEVQYFDTTVTVYFSDDSIRATERNVGVG